MVVDPQLSAEQAYSFVLQPMFKIITVVEGPTNAALSM